MLQQMFSPQYQVGEVASLVHPFDARPGGDELPCSSAAEDFLDCTVRRNYRCTKCIFNTRNPRVYLAHIRDVHFEKISNIICCPHCVYATQHPQQYERHIKVLHLPNNSGSVKMDTEVALAILPPSLPLSQPVSQRPPSQPETAPAAPEPPEERMEDLLEEVEECDDDLELDVDEYIISDPAAAEAEKTTSTPKPFNKGTYFSCSKCNYVTHIKARYTKHVKYHSMPMIKCTICDFRSPYKWNLDRHMKNHGGSGSFKCFTCNFTADIKQSLTLHEVNHHTPSVGQSVPSRRRNRVGASDMADALIQKEEEGSGDSRSSVSEMGLFNAEKDIVSCHSDSNDADASDNGIKKSVQSPTDMQDQLSPNSSTDDSKFQKQVRKPPRPLPPLIPLHVSTPNQNKTSAGEPPCKKFKESSNPEVIEPNKLKPYEHLPVDISIVPVNANSSHSKESGIRKKNESFFDKLKERLLTETGAEGSLKCKNCGFESKCLSEHSVHEKNCTSQLNRTASNTLHPNLSSTRCQNCRHRCKSSADLYIHLQTCQKSDKVDDDNVSMDIKNQDSNEDDKSVQEKEAEPHPMENVVFVWNNISHSENKYNTPLDININDDSTMPDINKCIYEIDTPDDNDSMNLSPSQALGKKVFKCPHCPFWASTASRFHVHIVGHLNKKPFECSICKYKSNWRWDITKHIKLKSARDPEHNEAKVLMTDETGRRNYSKYNQFLAMSVLNEKGENVFHYLDLNASADSMMEIDEHLGLNDTNDSVNHSTEIQPLNLQTYNIEQKYESMDNRTMDVKKPKRTLWKCKKCNYRDSSREALLEHVREHAKVDGSQEPGKKLESLPDPADLAYRCGHCNQLSNWKHVIQRHCRLKHNGIIKVITTVKPKPDLSMYMNDINGDNCTKCPFRSADKKLLLAHVQQHQPSAQSIFKCFFCPFFVKDETELVQHLLLHGITEPEEYIANAVGRKSPLAEVNHSASTKRHKCTDCPYETNSKSQYMYHEQFHRLPADTPYKCPECNYSVSKRHLLHQHLRVHGIISKKIETEAELEAKAEPKIEFSINLDEIPFVWVSAKNEFHKMYKCRYCSYVNSQKCKIPNHEKIHCITVENSDVTVFKCLECKFTCEHAIRLAEHSRTHGEIYGRIYCPVDDDIPDEEQIAKLRKVIESEKPNVTDSSVKEENVTAEKNEVKILYFCQMCPCRFFFGDELKTHDKFHDFSHPNKCNQCQFSVPTENDLTEHVLAHSDEYHTKTKMLKFMHNSHASHTQPRLELVHCPSTSDISWIVSNPRKNYDFESNANKKFTDTKHTPKQYLCKECPAKFFKSSALNYHAALHGGEGEHKCKKCNYTVKNIGNLAKHELLHENERKACDYESGDDMDYKNIPLSGTDLFQRKTEAQKRVLNDKDKLVKPNDHFPPVLQADPQFGYLMHGNPEFIYPTYLKNGRQKEKRYKCHKCPSAFEKREQYKIHLSLHGSKQRYKCELCDYSVKYYANYVQHMRKHQMNDEAQAERKKSSSGVVESDCPAIKQEDGDNIKLAIKTMPKGVPKSDFQQFSVRDQQTLRLLQRRRSLNNSKDQSSPTESPAKERKLHMCLLCPYTNQRQDALNNHYRRHDETDVLNTGSHKCSYCDLVVSQSHFLREHLKTHFSYQKNLAPDCYVANEDVSFTMTNEDEDETSIDLKLEIDIKSEDFKCYENKIFVKIQTGELVAE